MGRVKKKTSHQASPAVKTANSVKQKYRTGFSPGKKSRVRRALIDVEEKKLSIRKAAQENSLSVSYLRRRLSGEVDMDSRNGPSPVFNRHEEKAMAGWLKEMAERGMGLKAGEFLDFVQNVVKKEHRKTPFVNGRPSHTWYQKFMERNADIVQIRTETPLELSRAKLTRKSIDEWYSKFRDFLIQYGMLHKPNCIYNADETGFNLAGRAGKVIGPARTKLTKHVQVPHVSGGPSKQMLTVMFCGCADGSMLPPFLVYPEPKPRGYNPLTGGIVGSDIAFTKKGWMDANTFAVFLEYFDKHACKDRPIVLLIDSVSSHISMSAFENAKKNGIHLYRIIPNATHLMQPLDKGVFGPLKQRWHQIARVHARENPGVPIGKETFSEKLKEAYLLFYKPLTVINSFRTSGIYPVDSTVICDEDLKPGLTYNQSDDENEETRKLHKTQCSQQELEAQGALRALEQAITTPTRQKYERRMEEGYDLLGQSPCFDVYKRLRHISERRASATCSQTEPAPGSSTCTSTSSDNQSGLDILASAALNLLEKTPSTDQTPSAYQTHQTPSADQPPSEDQTLSADQPPSEDQTLYTDQTPSADQPRSADQTPSADHTPSADNGERESHSVLSPVLQQSLVLPKSTKPKKKPPKRLLQELPQHLTSKECIRKMALNELSKVKKLAEKEKKAKKKYLASIQKILCLIPAYRVFFAV